MKIVLGAGKTKYDGWTSTQETELDLLNRADFERMFNKEKPLSKYEDYDTSPGNEAFERINGKFVDC